MKKQGIAELMEAGYTEAEAFRTMIKELRIINAHDEADDYEIEAKNAGIEI